MVHFYAAGSSRNLIFPPSVDISAGRDINISQAARTYGIYVLMPSTTGNLVMTAGNDIVFTSGSTPVQMIMSDASLSLAYTLESRTAVNLLSLEGEVRDSHGFVVVSLNGEPNDEPLHYGDTSPVNLQAGGDIEGVNITVPKAGMIEAGGDIGSLVYFGQNIGASDVTRIVAGGNITYSYGAGTAATKETIELGGPGVLLVQAGVNIDLGNTIGITTIGNCKNEYLGSAGASIVVAAGVPSGVPSVRKQPIKAISSVCSTAPRHNTPASSRRGTLPGRRTL